MDDSAVTHLLPTIQWPFDHAMVTVDAHVAATQRRRRPPGGGEKGRNDDDDDTKALSGGGRVGMVRAGAKPSAKLHEFADDDPLNQGAEATCEQCVGLGCL